MQISVSDAKAQLTELVRRAEAGEEVILTRHGHAVARLSTVTAKPRLTPEEKRKLIDDFQRSASAKATPGPDAAHSADFLYGDDGMPA